MRIHETNPLVRVPIEHLHRCDTATRDSAPSTHIRTRPFPSGKRNHLQRLQNDVHKERDDSNNGSSASGKQSRFIVGMQEEFDVGSEKPHAHKHHKEIVAVIQRRDERTEHRNGPKKN
ncbi:hypothetical protein TcCL_NonESM03349 [Trypanosoma cruzi]|nr:hypothetical protein TcCL_NonESM03349 [Trypanosoma cruzi]